MLLDKLEEATYLANLTISNYKCFKGKQQLNFLDKEGKPSQWTVILGNNNTGKTSVLRVLAHLLKGTVPTTIYSLTEESELKPWIAQCLSYSLDIEVGVIRRSDSFAHVSLAKNKTRGCGYGITRKIGRNGLKAANTLTQNNRHFDSLLDENVSLLNLEEWLIQMDYALKNGRTEVKLHLDKVMKVLTSNLLPDIQEFRFISDKQFNNFVEVKTHYGWIKLRDLGYGYQAFLGWIADFMKYMFDTYPDSEHPLQEPAILLIDELDLHLHPEWQRKVVQFLSTTFPRTQFIVTSHSPLVVQSADKVNLILLQREADGVQISNLTNQTFLGWTVEEILRDLMDLDKTHSDAYINLFQQFDEGLDEENYEKAKVAYEKLNEILHPNSYQKKLLKIHMTSLIPS